MENNTSYTLLDKYNEKIHLIEEKLKNVVGHPIEQSRLLIQLKVYINSMINDISKMNDSDCYEDIIKLYNNTNRILSTVTSVITGTDVNTNDELTDSENLTKEILTEKFKNILGGIDKVMIYLETLIKPVEESTFYDEMDLADEATTAYKIMRKLQTNAIALNHQLNEQRKFCSNKYSECKSNPEMEKEFVAWLNKQKNAVQRKINGKEIKNKNALQKFITLYDSYLSKFNNVSNESFIEEIFR